jgi:predicted permease
MTSLISDDVRSAGRLFRLRAAFAWSVVATVAVATGFLGMTTGLATALMTPRVADVADVSRVVALYRRGASGEIGPAALQDFADVQATTTLLDSIGAVDRGALGLLKVGADLHNVRVSRTHGRLLDTLGLTLTNAPSDATAAAARSPAAAARVVISHSLAEKIRWSGRTSGDASILVDGRPYTVVGVAPAGFAGLSVGPATDVWVTQASTSEPSFTSGGDELTIVGRLRADASREALARELGRDGRTEGLTVVPFHELDPAYRAAVRPIAIVLVLAGAMVLAAAIVNLATLAMSHYATRLAEFAIRASLGGTPQRLVRQLHTEGLVLSFASCVLAGVCSFWTRQLVFAWLSPEQAAIVDSRAPLADALLPATTAFVACAIVFAWCARRASGLGLPLLHGESGNLTTAARGTRPHGGLVVAQVAVACCLVIAGVLVHGALQRSLEIGPGTVADHVAVVSTFAPGRYSSYSRGTRFQLDALQQVFRVSGIASVAWTSTLPLVSAPRAGYARDLAGPFANHRTIVVSSGYFATMKQPILEGREFTTRDDAIDSGAVIVNRTFARTFAGKGASLGTVFFGDDRKPLHIVGVVDDVKFRKMEDAAEPTVYIPMSKRYLAGLHLVARTAGPATAVAPEIVRALGAIDAVEIERETTLAHHLQTAVRRDRVATVLVVASGLLILGFALTGPYLLTRHAVTSRYDELAVRLAFGARAGQILGLVLSRALRATGLGILLGEAMALALAASFAGVPGVAASAATEVFVWTGVGLALLCALSALVPALGAYRVRPMAALR